MRPAVRIAAPVVLMALLSKMIFSARTSTRPLPALIFGITAAALKVTVPVPVSW